MTNTPEANKSILEVKTLDAEAQRLFPAAWLALPKSTEAVFQKNDEAGNLEYLAPVKPVMLKCAGPVATDEEIQQVVDKVKEHGEPVAFLVQLACLEVVDFPDGEDPTVKDFFEGNFDLSKVQKKLALVSYAHFVETK